MLDHIADQLIQDLNDVFDQKKTLQDRFFEFIDRSLGPDFNLEHAKEAFPDEEERLFSQNDAYCELIRVIAELFPGCIEQVQGNNLKRIKEKIPDLPQPCNDILTAITRNADDLLTGKRDAANDDPEALFKATFTGIVTKFYDDKARLITKNAFAQAAA